MGKRIIETNKIDFDLKRACAECPFRKDAAPHDGIMMDLAEINHGLNTGQGIFTCHKTDPESDSTIGQNYSGRLQHCAGFMAMAIKSEKETDQMIDAQIDGKLDIMSIEVGYEIFSQKEFTKKYIQHAEKKLREIRAKEG